MISVDAQNDPDPGAGDGGGDDVSDNYFGNFENLKMLFYYSMNLTKSLGVVFSPNLSCLYFANLRLLFPRNVLVATDVAARGLDLKRVSVVVSYEPAVP